MKRIDAPETAALLADADLMLTVGEARQLERELAQVARAYGRAQARVRKLKGLLRLAERAVKDIRREMRMLISARRVK